jgi:hypothetical protein
LKTSSAQFSTLNSSSTFLKPTFSHTSFFNMRFSIAFVVSAIAATVAVAAPAPGLAARQAGLDLCGLVQPILPAPLSTSVCVLLDVVQALITNPAEICSELPGLLATIPGVDATLIDTILSTIDCPTL